MKIIEFMNYNRKTKNTYLKALQKVRFTCNFQNRTPEGTIAIKPLDYYSKKFS